mgnify:CR=1 FL=1
MAVQLDINPTPEIDTPEEYSAEEKVAKENKPAQATVELQIRKMLDGNVCIYDHPELDLVIMPTESKLITFPKGEVTEEIYESQMRVFKYLAQHGIIDRGSIQAGNVYNAIEAKIFEAVEPDVSPLQVTILALTEFLEEEKPLFANIKAHEEEFERSLLHPDDENSTELGEVPHAEKKGSETGLHYRPYLTTYNYFYDE